MRDNQKWLAIFGPILGFFVLYFVLGAAVGGLTSRLSDLRDYGPATTSEVQQIEAETAAAHANDAEGSGEEEIESTDVESVEEESAEEESAEEDEGAHEEGGDGEDHDADADDESGDE